MNIKRITTSLALAFATIGVPATTYASDDPAKVESDSVARLSAATVVSNRHGRYLQARAIAEEGGGSVRGRTTTWLGDMQAYIEGWTMALALADLRTNVPYAAFEGELTRTLQQQSQKLAGLSDEAGRIGALAEAALTLIDKPAAIPAYAEAGQFQSTVDTLEAREGELRTMLQEVGQVASSKTAKLGDVDTLSRKAVVGRLKVALLANGRYPLDETLTQVNGLLLAEKAIDPTIARLTTTFTKMNEYNANLAFFHAEQAIAPARADCASARAAMNGLPASTFVNDAKARVGQLCDGIESLYTSTTGDASITHAGYVGEYLRTGKTKLPSACPSTVSSPACEKLSIFASLLPADLAKMDDAHLRFIELGFSDALTRALGK